MNKTIIKEIKKELKVYANRYNKKIVEVHTTKDNTYGTGHFQLFGIVPAELSNISINNHNVSLIPDTYYYAPVDTFTEDYYSDEYPVAYKLSKSVYALHVQKNLYDIVTSIFGSDIQVKINTQSPYLPILFYQNDKLIAMVAPLRLIDKFEHSGNYAEVTGGK